MNNNNLRNLFQFYLLIILIYLHYMRWYRFTDTFIKSAESGLTPFQR